jgi:8-oxo-dGTP diphosphatase
MKQFMDILGNKVELSFEHPFFDEQAQHVLVICESDEGWVLTNHKERGWEFPGGKREKGESLAEAAHREVYEETGAILSEILKIAEYRFIEKELSFIKGVFWGKVDKIEQKRDYLETNGPIVVNRNILTERFQTHYSFIMKDQVVEACLHRINEIKLENEK